MLDSENYLFKLLNKHKNHFVNLIDRILTWFDVNTSVSSNELAHIPKDIWLAQNYPNPFNPSTTIRFGISQNSDVQLNVFNILGEKVAELVSGKLSAGNHDFTWDGHNYYGQQVASGVYFYRLSAGESVIEKKMMFVQ